VYNEKQSGVSPKKLHNLSSQGPWKISKRKAAEGPKVWTEASAESSKRMGPGCIYGLQPSIILALLKKRTEKPSRGAYLQDNMAVVGRGEKLFKKKTKYRWKPTALEINWDGKLFFRGSIGMCILLMERGRSADSPLTPQRRSIKPTGHYLF